MISTDLLKSFLGDTYALMIKTHFFHWNVMGPEFPALHSMFEKQYTDLFEAADVVAERVRALGDHPPGGTKTFAQMTSIDDPVLGLDANGILDVLIQDHKNMAERAKKGIKVANQANDDVTVDLLIGRVREHEKQIWLMSSMRKVV
jgi:starvation-inducible DNA-binding protein